MMDAQAVIDIHHEATRLERERCIGLMRVAAADVIRTGKESDQYAKAVSAMVDGSSVEEFTSQLEREKGKRG